jgi:hypothetical protein
MDASSLPNLFALVSSLVAVMALSAVARKLGGGLGTMLKLLLLGIFLSVFVHAGVELAQTAGLLEERALMQSMGILITVGSVSFCAAAWSGLKTLR